MYLLQQVERQWEKKIPDTIRCAFPKGHHVMSAGREQTASGGRLVAVTPPRGCVPAAAPSAEC